MKHLKHSILHILLQISIFILKAETTPLQKREKILAIKFQYTFIRFPNSET